MDNTNTNWPNNPAPTSPAGPAPDPTLPQTPPNGVPAPASTWPTSPLPSTPPISQPDPTPQTLSPNPTWTPPTQPVPDPQATGDSSYVSQNYAAPEPPAAAAPWPANPTSSPQPTMPSAEPAAVASSSPLDNPWGAPVQPPAIDGSPPNTQPSSTWPASPTPNDAPTSPVQPIPQEPASPTPDSVPTDLSHLISNNSQPGAETPPAASAETLVVPPTSNAAPDVPTVPTEAHKGIPIWLIGVGIGLLIMVAGASAYFILGIGQPPKTTTSIPAEVTEKPTVKTPPPIANQSQPAGAATGSANFGDLQGSASATPAATSAAELLKQRQQGR